MGIFDFFMNSDKDKESVEQRQSYFEFTKTYPFTVLIPDFEIGQDYFEEISGDITYTAEVEWNETTDQYDVTILDWDDNTGRFTHDGSAPAKEDDFYEDLKDYLISQGVSEFDIDW
ncbi:hypothetical protein BI362_11690 [Streptococcus parauberis]|uniref:Uncharacterized protein n=1 Tax=Streptococcus bovimastitidis TaxID=1856638 RepID=A0A1L8ML22_9STRE|nr:hypothetical protein [Streptococcus bovimastitidis]OHY29416.1 hypothetical protein BI362_11690 [Streptococcus parauberis]OJF71426.1 hypothetical protein A9Q68_09605 [Streptococcus bovimastitidis]